MNRTAIIGALAMAAAFAEPLTQSDRDKAMSHFHATRKVFLDSVAGLSDAQWKLQGCAGALVNRRMRRAYRSE